MVYQSGLAGGAAGATKPYTHGGAGLVGGEPVGRHDDYAEQKQAGSKTYSTSERAGPAAKRAMDGSFAAEVVLVLDHIKDLLGSSLGDIEALFERAGLQLPPVNATPGSEPTVNGYVSEILGRMKDIRSNLSLLKSWTDMLTAIG